MWHLFKNTEKKYEFAFISKGRYIAGTKQGYNNYKDAVKSLYNVMRAPLDEVPREGLVYQDDVHEKPIVYTLYSNGEKRALPSAKKQRKYIPYSVYMP